MPVERKIYQDKLSHIELAQLTDYRGHSHHLYFTNPGWYDRNRRLLFASERNNCNNLFALELATGEIEQLTMFDDAPRDFLASCVNSVCDEVYFRSGDALLALDLRTKQLRQLYQFDSNWDLHMMNVTADGKFICFGIFADPDYKIRNGIQNGGISFEEAWRLRPLSRIVKVAVSGGPAQIIHEEPRWIGHVNTSPRHPHLLSFCYEGPWDKVGQRIWVMNLESGAITPVRPIADGEIVGHEYWYADGERLGYHGRNRAGDAFFGRTRFDNTGTVDTAFPGGGDTGHIFSLDETMVAGDGDGVIKLWKLSGGHYLPPRILCTHDSGMRIQKTHPHPRFSPDGKAVLFTSDVSGYANLYLASIDNFDRLPVFVEDKSVR